MLKRTRAAAICTILAAGMIYAVAAIWPVPAKASSGDCSPQDCAIIAETVAALCQARDFTCDQGGEVLFCGAGGFTLECFGCVDDIQTGSCAN